MRAILYVLVFLLSSSNLFANENKALILVRNQYYLASENKNEALVFEKLVGKFDNTNLTIFGYKGMAFMLKAKYAWNPQNKLEYFNKGKLILEAAIVKAPKNIELLFMRFCIQSNAPAFLFYRSNIKEDKSAILESYDGIKDLDLKKRVRNYMLSSEVKLNKNEKLIFKQ